MFECKMLSCSDVAVASAWQQLHVVFVQTLESGLSLCSNATGSSTSGTPSFYPADATFSLTSANTEEHQQRNAVLDLAAEENTASDEVNYAGDAHVYCIAV